MVLGISFVRDGGPVRGGSANTAQGTSVMSKAKSWFSGFGKMVKSVVSPVAKPYNSVAGVNAYVDVPEMAPGSMEGEEVSGGHRIGVTTEQDAVNNSNYKPKLPEFSGKEDWEDYYSMFCAAANLANWNDNRRFIELWLRLQGEATEVCAGVIRQPGLPTFQALANALHDRFVCDRESCLLLLQNARREESESLDQLADRLRKLYLRAYPNRSVEQAEEELGYYFYSALCEDTALTDQIYVERNNTLSAILKIAKEFEIHKKVRDQMAGKASGTEKIPVEQEKCVEPQIQEGIDRGRAVIRAATRECTAADDRKPVRHPPDMQQFSTARCFLCDSPQHLQRFCPLNGERLSGRGRGRGSVSRPRGDREGGRGWRGSVQEEGIGQWPTPESTIQEEN